MVQLACLSSVRRASALRVLVPCLWLVLLMANAEEQEPPFIRQQQDLEGVDDGFGLQLCLDIEAPIADKLMEKDDCASGSGCQPPLDDVQKLVILGSGPAGLSAAIYAARANLDPVVISIDGGQLEGTSEVENYPGAHSSSNGCDGSKGRPLHGVSGQAIVETFNEQARAFGTRFVEGWVESISLPEPPFELKMTGGSSIRANALIVASGATTKWLGLPSETKYRGSGVSSCATCDGFFFKNQRVAVIGGGDSAMEEALFLARICTSVKLIHRRAKFSATPMLIDQVLENPKIEVIWDSVVEEFYSHNDDLLSHVIVKNVQTGKLRDLEVEGAFVAIGHQPSTQLFEVKRPDWSELSSEERQAAAFLNLTARDWPPVPRPGTVVELDSEGYIITERQSTATTVPGIFAAGDVSDNVYRQAITSAGSGAMAALDAERWLCRLGC